jgi:TatD DNase family protein
LGTLPKGLKSSNWAAFPGKVILHWFSGTLSELDQAVSGGLYFSVNPAMILSRSGQALIARIPRERMLTETDGPFVEVDGQPARPGSVALVIEHVANVWGIPAASVRAIMATNFQSLLENAASAKK